MCFKKSPLEQSILSNHVYYHTFVYHLCSFDSGSHLCSWSSIEVKGCDELVVVPICVHTHSCLPGDSCRQCARIVGCSTVCPVESNTINFQVISIIQTREVDTLNKISIATSSCFLIEVRYLQMSYCSIEEAWGAPFEAPSAGSQASHRTKHANKSRRRKKRESRSLKIQEGFANPPNQMQTDTPCVWGEQHWEQPDNIHHDDVHARQFSRDRPSGQLPEAVQVSLQGAPFAEEPTIEASTVNRGDSSQGQPVVVSQVPEAESEPSPEVTPVIHEELDWMRNHMTHLTSKIDKLSSKLDTHVNNKTSTQSEPSSMQPTIDSVLYVITGIFSLALIDIVFRAGQRTTSYS